MIIYLSAIILVLPGHQARPSGHWPAAMAKRARSQAQTATRPSIILSDPTYSTVLDGSTGPDETNNVLGAALLSADRASKDGRLEEARSVLEKARAELPDRSILVPRLLDVYFRQGRDKEAYRLVAPYMQDGADDAFLLRGSLAAARLGETYAGQRQYLDRFFRERVTSRWDSVKASVPRGESARALEVLSLLAIGKTQDGFDDANMVAFMNEANRLDPGNPVAAYALGNFYLRKHRYAEAEKAYRAGLKRALDYYRDAMRENARIAAWLKDRRPSGG